MFYSKWWIYRNLYLEYVRRQQVNSYLRQIKQESKPMFIHINRTAGSSIASGLGITQIHFTLLEYEQLYCKKYKRKLPNTLPVISCIRNPYDRVASEYYYRTMHNQNNLKTNPIRFEDWVVEVYWLKNKKYRDREIMFMPQYKWLESKGVYEFHLLRYETLAEDYKLLEQHYGATSLPWKKATNKPEYTEVFTAMSREIVEQVFKEDLKNFNYSY